MGGKQLRGIKGESAVKAFLRAGGIKKSTKGSHVNLKMLNGQLITIPVTKELKIGLIKDALRKADLTESQFLELL